MRRTLQSSNVAFANVVFFLSSGCNVASALVSRSQSLAVNAGFMKPPTTAAAHQKEADGTVRQRLGQVPPLHRKPSCRRLKPSGTTSTRRSAKSREATRSRYYLRGLKIFDHVAPDNFQTDWVPQVASSVISIIQDASRLRVMMGSRFHVQWNARSGGRRDELGCPPSMWFYQCCREAGLCD